jgi:hypothetical protein
LDSRFFREQKRHSILPLGDKNYKARHNARQKV